MNKFTPILPKEAYYAQEWFNKEMSSIFSKTWQFAGFTEDINDAGDYITVQAGLNNIFVVKGRDQNLRAFHNICRHRGTQLLRAVGKKQKAITCPYHDWTYNLNGDLISVPEKEKEFPYLKMEHCKLKEASVQTWRGMIFIHPEKDAPPIQEWFGKVEEKLGPHRPWELVEFTDVVTDETINANWKIIVENYIDVYHLSHLHSATLNMYDHGKAEFGFVGPHYWFIEPLEKGYEADIENLAPYPLIDHMPKDKLRGYVPWLFPNLGLGELESSWSIFLAIPLAPDKTRVIVRSKTMNVSEAEYRKQERKSNSNPYWTRLSAKYDGDPEIDPMSSGDFMAEDIFACEQQQKSLQSPFFEIGASAQWGEASVRGFQKVIKEWVEKKC